MMLRADYFSRIRPSDISNNYHALADNIMLLLGVVILFIVLCFAVAYIWQVHKATVKAIGKFILACLCIYIVLVIGNYAYYKLKHNRAAKKENTQVISSIPVRVEENNYSQESAVDAWASYPAAKGVTSSQKENDWLVAATNNPSFSIYDLITISGMTPDNTQFLSEEDYRQSNWVRKHYTPGELHLAYIKLATSWKAFMRCKNVEINSPEIDKYMMRYDMFDTHKPKVEDANNPQLIKDLQRIPLQD